MLNLNSFEHLKHWITNSGLQINDYSDPNFGGVYSFYDEKNQKYDFIYPEITGYYISSMRFLHNISNDQKYIKKAESAALWLIKLENKYGGIIQGVNTQKNNEQLVYSFDTGICAKGFLDCYELTKKNQFLKISKKLLNWIIDEALENDGTVKPLKNLKTNKFEENQNLWYKQKGCLHIKTSMPFFHMYHITKEPVFLEKAELICNTFTKFQTKDMGLSLHLNDNLSHLHSICYALEGLLYAYYYTKNNEYITTCNQVINWCSKKIQNDNSIELWFNSKYQHSKSSYAIAQLIRLMILTDKISNTSKNKNNIEKLNHFLQTLQSLSSNPKINGGYYEEFFKSILGWKKRLRINSWGSMFALQALYWFDSYENLDFEKEIQFLY
jgi:uncharacterized protein YyaL (SSP411 family)